MVAIRQYISLTGHSVQVEATFGSDSISYASGCHGSMGRSTRMVTEELLN